MKKPKFQVKPKGNTKSEKEKANIMEKLLDYQWSQIQPYDIFFSPGNMDHLYCKWYCKFLFWKQHPKFIQKREFVSYKDLL